MSLVLTESGSYMSPDDPGETGYRPKRGAPRLSITDEEGEILAQLVRGLAVLEIGTGLGVSTRWMAKTAKVVYTIDNDEWVQHKTWPELRELDNVIPYHSLEGLRVYAAFIDGCHRAPAVEKDIARAMAVVPIGGLLILHDTKANCVRMGIEAMLPHEALKEYDTEYGLGVWQRREWSQHKTRA